jgi:hypothetical protein
MLRAGRYHYDCCLLALPFWEHQSRWCRYRRFRYPSLGMSSVKYPGRREHMKLEDKTNENRTLDVLF